MGSEQKLHAVAVAMPAGIPDVAQMTAAREPTNVVMPNEADNMKASRTTESSAALELREAVCFKDASKRQKCQAIQKC